MSTKHIETAADLVRFSASIRIDCGKCGATRTLSGAQMVKACGAGDLQTSERRLKCSRCGGKEAWLTILPPL
jgi:ribosomal protein S27AE